MATPADPPDRDHVGHLDPVDERDRGVERAASARADRVRARADRVRARRARYRRQRVGALTLFLLAAALLGVDLAHGEADRSPSSDHAVAASGPDATGGLRPGADPAGSRPAGAESAGTTGTTGANEANGAAGDPSDPASPSYPATGPGSFGYAAGSGPVLGRSGQLRRYRVAVEERIGQDVTAFAAEVDAILGDERGWTASEQLRLQRVPRDGAADFTVLLATPATSERMCAAGGLHTERYTSCRLPGKVIINLARWLTAIPEYGASLEVYRAYAINHEVGHELGHGHEACPGGGPAPVMQQQTYGMRGCTANGWPYLSGRRHRGPAIP